MTRPARLVCALFLVGSTFSAFASVALSQTSEQAPIRVDSNLVVARATVFDKKHMGKVTDQEKKCMLSELESFYNLEPTAPFIRKVCWGVVVSDLVAGDFHVFVEGKEQKIQAVTVENGDLEVRDNLGSHKEYSDTPAGKWSMPDTPPLPPGKRSVTVSEGYNEGEYYYFYNIAFAPEEPGSAGCHKIKTKVNRPHSDVYYRQEYCAGQTPSDPLAGTKLSKQMEAELSSGESGKIAVSLQAGVLYTSKDKAQVQISLEFPRDSLARHWEDDWALHATIGALGIAQRKEGSLATRFSDLACCTEYTSCRLLRMSPLAFNDMYYDSIIHPIFDFYDRACIPTGYETQVELAPGEYDLRLVLSDGEKFGRVEMHLKIDRYDEKELALSSIMLCKRFRDAHVAAVETAAANFAPQYVPLVSKGVQFTPTGGTHFKRTEQMFGYFEIYEPLLTSAITATAQAHIRIADEMTGKLIKDFGGIDVTSYINAGSTVIPIGREIPLQSLPRGSYLLEVQATDSAGRSTPWRTANFTVE